MSDTIATFDPTTLDVQLFIFNATSSDSAAVYIGGANEHLVVTDAEFACSLDAGSVHNVSLFAVDPSAVEYLLDTAEITAPSTGSVSYQWHGNMLLPEGWGVTMTMSLAADETCTMTCSGHFNLRAGIYP